MGLTFSSLSFEPFSLPLFSQSLFFFSLSLFFLPKLFQVYSKLLSSQPSLVVCLEDDGCLFKEYQLLPGDVSLPCRLNQHCRADSFPEIVGFFSGTPAPHCTLLTEYSVQEIIITLSLETGWWCSTMLKGLASIWCGLKLK